LRASIVWLEEIERQDDAAAATNDFDINSVNLEARRFIGLLLRGFWIHS
jgi:hypothetical protein